MKYTQVDLTPDYVLCVETFSTRIIFDIGDHLVCQPRAPLLSEQNQIKLFSNMPD